MANTKITSIIVDKLYPVVEAALIKNDQKFRNNISDFINKNHKIVFSDAPYDRLYFNQNDVNNLFNSLELNESDILSIIKNTYWYDIPYNPQCVKEPYVEILFCAIRYYLLKSKQKEAEITTIYLAFSGKFYASLHGMFFQKCPPSKYPEVMQYVVNTMITDKFDIKKEGTVFGAIKSLCTTWINTYGSSIKGSPDDDGVGKLLQQLRDREKSFMGNIANLYYEAYENKYYLNYESDSLDPNNFRLTDNDATIAARITESSMNYITSNYVSLDICNKCKDVNVKATEIKDIIESIISNNSNLPDIKKVINILICDYMKNYPHQKVSSIEFISYSIKAKPNTKDKYLLDMKTTILKWLDENSTNYRKRKSRKATALSYYRSILMYFVLIISRVSQKIY
jgi:hypothetical protein